MVLEQINYCLFANPQMKEIVENDVTQSSLSESSLI